MNTMPHDEVLVTLGVDTHADVHMVVALDQLGRFLDALEIATTRAGYRRLLAWAGELGIVDQVGIEGTGSYGAGLTRYLRGEGVAVVEADRPDRRIRRHRGKSDLVDAEAAARAVQSGRATVEPKTYDGNVEMIQVLRIARRSAQKTVNQTGNQLLAMIGSAPEELREQFRGPVHAEEGPQGRSATTRAKVRHGRGCDQARVEEARATHAGRTRRGRRPRPAHRPAGQGHRT